MRRIDSRRRRRRKSPVLAGFVRVAQYRPSEMIASVGEDQEMEN